MSENSNPVPVVCALIERDGLVLLAQRPAGKHLGGQWEFPGGKVEAGERPAAALQREIREELGCEIVVGHALPRSVHTYDHGAIELIPYVCGLEADSPPPAALEHSAIAWVAPADLPTYDLAPADLPVLADYLGQRASGN